MTQEQYIQWALDRIKRAQLGKLRGSVTFHFSDGLLVSGETKHNEKPSLDDIKK
jgi:hypothetical protein